MPFSRTVGRTTASEHALEAERETVWLRPKWKAASSGSDVRRGRRMVWLHSGRFALGADRENRDGPCCHATCNGVGSAAKLAQPRIDWTADAQAANQSALIRFKIDHPNRSARFRKNRSDPPGQIPAREETGPPSLREPSLSSTQTPLSSISGEWGGIFDGLAAQPRIQKPSCPPSQREEFGTG